MTQDRRNPDSTRTLYEVIRNSNPAPRCRCKDSRDDHKPTAFKEKLHRGRPIAKEWGECLVDDCDCVGYSPDVN